MPVLGALVRGYHRLLRGALTLLMGVMIVPVTLQVVSRYSDAVPRYIWTEEAARFCFIWIIMLGATIGVRDGSHFVVDVLPRPRTARGQALAELIAAAAMLTMALVFVVYGWDYGWFGYVQTSELTGINMLSIHIVYLLAGLGWTAFLTERVAHAVALWRGSADEHR